MADKGAETEGKMNVKRNDMRTIIVELENGLSEEFEVRKSWSMAQIDTELDKKFGNMGWLGWVYKTYTNDDN